MNYIRSVWKLEDKFRLFAILIIAIAVTVLSFVDMHQDRMHDHHETHAAQHN